MGRNTRGVRGISLGASEVVVGMVVIENDEKDILAISANGYGKRTDLDDYRVQSRGGKGIITMKTTSKTGDLVSIKGVLSTDDLMIVTTSGILIRITVEDISTMGRNTQGVRLIKLKGDDAIADVTRIVEDRDADEEASGDETSSDNPVSDPPVSTEE